MTDIVRDFFEWRYHAREFYDGVIIKALKDRPVSLNFSKQTGFVGDSTYFGLITAQPSKNGSSSVSFHTACFPNKNSPDFTPTKPNKEWGQLNEKKTIPVKGRVNCCTTDKLNNIFVGSNEAIQIITKTDTLTKDMEKPVYMVRDIPDGKGAPLFVVEDEGLIRYFPDNDRKDKLCDVDRPVLDMSVNSQDPSQVMLVQGRKSVLFYDFREEQTEPIAKLNYGATSVAFSNNHQFLFVVGFATGHISMFDFRAPQSPLVTVHAHDLAVTSVKWSPIEQDIVASASQDTAIALWSFRNSTAQEVPSVFAHNGHAAPITAFDWCPDLPWTLASISEDNLFEVWSISPSQIEEYM